MLFRIVLQSKVPLREYNAVIVASINPVRIDPNIGNNPNFCLPSIRKRKHERARDNLIRLLLSTVSHVRQPHFSLEEKKEKFRFREEKKSLTIVLSQLTNLKSCKGSAKSLLDNVARRSFRSINSAVDRS